MFHSLQIYPLFRMLIFGTLATNTAFWMYQVAVGWLALEMTDSAAFVGLAGFVAGIPILLFSIPAGIVIDRFDKRTVLLVAQTGIMIVASLFERRAAGLYHNTAVVLERDGGIAGRYRKMHIPDDPGFYEKFYFTPGDLGFTPIDTSVGRLGVLVCWDQWYPEAARLMALTGAELLLYPTAIGWDPSDNVDERERQREAWLTVQRGHAVANGLPLLSCNRVGLEPAPRTGDPGIQFWGSSFVCGPQGEWLGRAGNGPETLIVDIDRRRSETVRRMWPFLRDRRIDAYADVVRRYID